MPQPRPHPGIERITPYSAGETTLPGFPRPALLSANESPLGPSPTAVAAARAALESAHLYPDAHTRALNEALAKRHGLDPAWVMCGTGSESLIEVLCRAFAGPGAEVVVPQFSFPMFAIYANAVGATVVTVPAPGFTADVDALACAVTPKTALVFLANPNNPTGTWVDKDAVKRLVDALPEHVLLALDSAYAEYLVGEPRYDAGLRFVTACPGRVVVLRTFSKLYALAGLRVGWMHADPRTIDFLLRARLIFPVASPSQAAAVAALDDVAHVRASVAHNARWLPFLTNELRAQGHEVLPSGGNFVLARFPGRWKLADELLKKHGVIARPLPPLEGLRLSVGREEDNRRVVEALAALPR
ncbi:MAG: aminotransferase class I/II-fold pyridoxal phosphate-dependent enzyme [Myxococcales bacterium]|nr:aminotransferase class I/II-fold pyridoxal phosphate-dependent enzyme [Myxococcales bacterium]